MRSWACYAAFMAPLGGPDPDADHDLVISTPLGALPGLSPLGPRGTSVAKGSSIALHSR